MVGSPRIFADRETAGVELARVLKRRSPAPPLSILSLPRGGVAVAAPVAKAFHAPLDVMVVRKIGMPGQPELAIGAIGPRNIIVREPHLAIELSAYTELDDRAFQYAAEEQRRELERREAVYRAGLPPLDLIGRTAILVDDGVATGMTMLAAVRAARAAGASRIIAAAPVASPDAAALVSAEADEVVFLQTPPLLAIGDWYQRFEQLDDAEVCRLLSLSRRSMAAPER